MNVMLSPAISGTTLTFGTSPKKSPRIFIRDLPSSFPPFLGERVRNYYGYLTLGNSAKPKPPVAVTSGSPQVESSTPSRVAAPPEKFTFPLVKADFQGSLKPD